MTVLKISVDYAHTFYWDEDLEKLGDGVIEVPPETLVRWESIAKAYEEMQEEIAELMTSVYEPTTEEINEEQQRRLKYIENGLLPNWLDDHPDHDEH